MVVEMLANVIQKLTDLCIIHVTIAEVYLNIPDEDSEFKSPTEGIN